ncbi:MAG: hypothetical protein ACFFD2_08070 [Promethearchaeota archaeon]
MKLELIEKKTKSYSTLVNACLDTCEAIKASPTAIKEIMKLLDRTKTAPFKGSTDILAKALEKGELTLTIRKVGDELIIKPGGRGIKSLK